MSLKIMVVDDEPLSLKIMRSLAVPLGHKVLTFSDSQEAIQEAEKQAFDVVFVGLPRLDGLELAARIPNVHPNSQTTVVVLDATNDIETLRRVFGVGVAFILPKPIASSRIIPMLTAMECPGWKDRKPAARFPLFTKVMCKWRNRDSPAQSINISETGMLLQSLQSVEVGQEVSLEFKIVELGASLNVRAGIVRLEGTDRAAVEFIDLAPEDRSAIRLCIMGHLKQSKPPRVFTDFRPNRIYKS